MNITVEKSNFKCAALYFDVAAAVGVAAFLLAGRHHLWMEVVIYTLSTAPAPKGAMLSVSSNGVMPGRGYYLGLAPVIG